VTGGAGTAKACRSHAYAQCRSNKGAPGVDGQDFADIETYGVQRWLGELALAIRQQAYRPSVASFVTNEPAPVRRVAVELGSAAVPADGCRPMQRVKARPLVPALGATVCSCVLTRKVKASPEKPVILVVAPR
jgi:hypothetical protein